MLAEGRGKNNRLFKRKANLVIEMNSLFFQLSNEWSSEVMAAELGVIFLEERMIKSGGDK